MMLLIVTFACTPAQPASDDLVVFAAASLQDALPPVGAAWTAQNGRGVTFVFDGTSRLAGQIDQGAPFDVFVAADVAWMDAAAAGGHVRPDSRVDLAGNTLVAIVPEAAVFVPAAPAELADARVAHLALAGENVPAGRYAREALRSAGAWDALAARVVDGADVRTALAWVARGEAEAGVVYATDARVEPGVRVAFAFPEGGHAPIVYPAAVSSRASDEAAARAWLAYARGEGAGPLRAAGFEVPP